MKEFFPPTIYHNGFNCPHCTAFTQSFWLSVSWNGSHQKDMAVSQCTRCQGETIWYKKVLIYPESTSVPVPNSDLSEDIQADYQEASSILSRSPRGAAALLRLCVQKLCVQLGKTGKKIDDDIANLVRKGLDVHVKMALDVVRVVGNEAVHPGTIDLNDTPEIAAQLFDLINLIAEIMISQPKKIAAMYASLPQEKLDGIEARDKKALSGTV